MKTWKLVDRSKFWTTSSWSSFNFINVLLAAFVPQDLNSVKRYWQLVWILRLLGATGVKAVRKYVGEIEPYRVCQGLRLTKRDDFLIHVWTLLNDRHVYEAAVATSENHWLKYQSRYPSQVKLVPIPNTNSINVTFSCWSFINLDVQLFKSGIVKKIRKCDLLRYF